MIRRVMEQQAQAPHREDELLRAFAFMAKADMAGSSVHQSPFGTIVRSDEVPLRQDSNYLLVDRTTAAATELANEVERLRLRAVFVRDEEMGDRLAGEFATLGWNAHRGVVMALHRQPQHAVDPSLVSEVGEADLRSLRRRMILGYPWGTPELADQLLRWKVLMSRRVDTRFFAVLMDDEVVAYADLYLGDGVAQIEDVLTAEDYRNRGYASAVVLRAIEEAQREGAELIFLAADADDWPKHLYERLGFDPIGGYVKFFT
jgi:ribosomal protein S18 acetylase RimI-like enzyme